MASRTPASRRILASLVLAAVTAAIASSILPVLGARPAATAGLDVAGLAVRPRRRRPARRGPHRPRTRRRRPGRPPDRRLRRAARPHARSDVDSAPGEHDWRWDGRTGQGVGRHPGPYRVVATIQVAGAGTLRRSAWVTLAARVPYPARPGAILVALDPGHGGIADGAVWRDSRRTTSTSTSGCGSMRC